MSKINQIQTAINSLDAGAYQKLMDAYIFKKYGLTNISPLGSHSGTNKTTKGTPDSFVRCEDGRFILIAHGTVGDNAFAKIEKDILKCLDKSKTGIEREEIYQIICCHTSTNLTPGQVKKLYSHFSNTVLIGLGDVSYDLYLKYPDLARDHLQVNIDTHQIFGIEEFIAYTSQNQYSTTLDMPCLCRKNEITELEKLLKENKATLILGPAGIGKTRIALDVAKNIATQENCILKIIRSNGEPIYEDIKAAFPDDRNYIVLVDDADQLVQLIHLLDLCIDPTRTHMMNIILTVRDYAKDKLLRTVNAKCIPAICKLTPLSDESISNVLSENLNIRNTDIIKHIQLIAKGNIRLAIMAGMCVINGRFDTIKNSFDLFNDYYSSVIGDFERDEIIIASLIAFFDSFTLDEKELPFGIALQQGINNMRFREICHTLHKKEVVSIFDDRAVKFENQNLRDYLLFYVFFKERWLAPSVIISHAFPVYRHKIIFAFNTLISLFNTDENIAYIEKEIRTAWALTKSMSDDTKFKFVEAFHAIIQDESLLYLKQKVDELPEFHENLFGFDFEKTSNTHTIRSEVIKILIDFKYSSRFKDAIQIALNYFERNSEYPMDIYFLFGEEWGIGYESHKHSYAQETLLIEELLKYYKQNKSILAAFCLMFASSYSLKLEFSATESNRNNTVTFYQFGILACDEIFALRTLSLHSLSKLLENPGIRKYAIKELLKYPSFTRSKTDNEIIAHDLDTIATSFGALININDFEICLVLDHFEEICQREGIAYTDQLPHYYQNQIYNLFWSLKKDYLYKCENWNDAESERRKFIESISISTSNEYITCLWEALKNLTDKGRIIDNWKISSGIDILFSSLAKNDPGKFLDCCESYILHQTPFWESNIGVINGLTEVLGYDEAIKFVYSHEFISKSRWLVILYDRVPTERINKLICAEIMKCLTESIDRNNYIVTLQTIYRVNSKYRGFLVEYVSALNHISERKPNLMSEFMNQIGWNRSPKVDELLDCFVESMDVLSAAYINAFRGRDHFDFNGDLLIQIIKRNKMFLSMFIQSIYKNGMNNIDISAFDILWEQDDYIDLISIVITSIFDESVFAFPWNSLGENILKYDRELCM